MSAETGNGGSIGDSLRKLVAKELGKRTEPWATAFKDPLTGKPYPEVVAALAQVGVGLAYDSAGTPLPLPIYLEQLAAWLVDTVLVNPTDPKTTYRAQFQAGVRLAFDTQHIPRPPARVLDTLAELALGAYKETDPRAKRVGGPVLVVTEYLRGAEALKVHSGGKIPSIKKRVPVSRTAVSKARVKKKNISRKRMSTKAKPRVKKTATGKAKTTKKNTRGKRKVIRRRAPRSVRGRARLDMTPSAAGAGSRRCRRPRDRQ